MNVSGSPSRYAADLSILVAAVVLLAHVIL